MTDDTLDQKVEKLKRIRLMEIKSRVMKIYTIKKGMGKKDLKHSDRWYARAKIGNFENLKERRAMESEWRIT